MCVVPVHEISQDVDFGFFNVRGEFDGGDDGKGRAARGLDRRIDRRSRVMIGNGNDIQPAFNRELDELRRREFAVGRVRVRVQIDTARRAV